MKMKKKIYLLLAIFTFSSFGTFAQVPDYITNYAPLDGKNIVKVNLTNLALKSGGFSYERILSKHISLLVSGTYMPASKIKVFSTLGSDGFGGGGVSSSYKDMLLGYMGISPELRFYLGKGYGNGVYLSPYFRYESFSVSNFPFSYDNNGKEETLTFEGNINASSGGMLLGYQWLMGKNKNIVLDWSIIGVHFGISNGNIHGKSSYSLSSSDIKIAQESLDNLLNEMPYISGNGTVTSNTMDVDIKGPWLFFRTGISLGYRF
jgi:hypothetical protein